MTRLALFFSLLVGILLPSLGSAELASAALHYSLVIEHTDGTAKARVGAVGFSDTGFDVIPLGDGSSPSGIPRIAELSVSTPMSLGALKAAARNWVAAHAEALRSKLVAYMGKYGLSSAWYVYERTFPVQTDLGQTPYTVTWSLFQDASGRASYGDPRVEPASASGARVLHVQYQVRAVPGEIGYSNPQGGILHWQVLDAGLNPIAGTSNYRDVLGAFDPPAGTTDSQQGIRCLIDSSRAGCAPAAQDVRRLLESTGALFALVDYTYAPEPAYTWKRDAYCPGGQSKCFVPATTYVYELREIKYEMCSDDITFRNAGYYTMPVESITDRFIVDLDELSPASLQRFTAAIGQSEGVDFDWQLILPIGEVGRLDSHVIHPHTGGALIPVTDVPGNVLTPTPLAKDGSPYCPPVTVSVSPAVHNVKTPGTFKATAAGGKPPYTYRWTSSDYKNGTITIGSPYSSVTSVTRSGPSLGQVGGTIGHVDVTVTDSRGQTASARVLLEIDAELPPLEIRVSPDAPWSSTYGLPAAVGECASTSNGSCQATTSPAPLFVTGGTGSYIVEWQPRQGASANINSRSSINTSFSRVGATPLEGVYRVTVYDGNSTAYKDIAVVTRHCITSCPAGYSYVNGQCERRTRWQSEPYCPEGYDLIAITPGALFCVYRYCQSGSYPYGCPTNTLRHRCRPGEDPVYENGSIDPVACERRFYEQATNSCS